MKTNCDHMFCSQCIRDWLGSNHSTCPTCKKNVSESELSAPGRIVKNVWSALRGKCKHAPHCPEEVNLSQLASHEASCLHGVANCSHSGCGYRCVRMNMPTHEAECDYRIAPCPRDCGQRKMFRQLQVGTAIKLCDAVISVVGC